LPITNGSRDDSCPLIVKSFGPPTSTSTFAASKQSESQPWLINIIHINMLQPITRKSSTTRLKALLDKRKMVLYLVACLSVFSCQENSLVNPEVTQSQNLTVALDQAMSPATKKYKLTKFGDQTLTYYPDGQIKGYVYPVGPSINLTATYTYNYTPGTIYTIGSINVVLHSPSPIAVNINRTYWFNATGHCYKYQEVDHQPSGDLTLMYILGYNPQGQLIDCLQWLNGSAHGREKYEYNADGDMIKVTSLDAQQVIYRTAILSYMPTNGGAPVNDLYPVGSRWRHPDEVYLPYFGQPSKHLVQHVVETLSGNPNDPTHYYYKYVLNADGYVIERNGTYKPNRQLFETREYEYEVTSINIPK
jgi:YD repeat-containing protein